MENTLSQRSTSTEHSANSQMMLVGLAIIVLLVMIATLAARLTGYSATSIPDTEIVAMRKIGFRDLPGGRVGVYEWHSEHELLVVESGEGSFLRGVVRSLVRQRAGMSDRMAMPFELRRHSDGRLVLFDPATSERIDLVAFGRDNSLVFAQLIDAPLPATSEPGTPW